MWHIPYIAKWGKHGKTPRRTGRPRYTFDTSTLPNRACLPVLMDWRTCFTMFVFSFAPAVPVHRQGRGRLLNIIKLLGPIFFCAYIIATRDHSRVLFLDKRCDWLLIVVVSSFSTIIITKATVTKIQPASRLSTMMVFFVLAVSWCALRPLLPYFL